MILISFLSYVWVSFVKLLLVSKKDDYRTQNRENDIRYYRMLVYYTEIIGVYFVLMLQAKYVLELRLNVALIITSF
jgi:hypothetical protein